MQQHFLEHPKSRDIGLVIFDISYSICCDSNVGIFKKYKLRYIKKSTSLLLFLLNLTLFWIAWVGSEVDGIVYNFIVMIVSGVMCVCMLTNRLVSLSQMDKVELIARLLSFDFLMTSAYSEVLLIYIILWKCRSEWILSVSSFSILTELVRRRLFSGQQFLNEYFGSFVIGVQETGSAKICIYYIAAVFSKF